jgi:hypothetical protein
MTRTRPEIIVEGSEDGVEWKAYEFAYKAGDPARRPPWVAPHQPRLDWQMWFAALGQYDEEPWFEAFCQRLLTASPDVLGLLRTTRSAAGRRDSCARLLSQHCSDRATRRAQGVWWTRERPATTRPSWSTQGTALTPSRALETTCITRNSRNPQSKFGPASSAVSALIVVRYRMKPCA